MSRNMISPNIPASRFYRFAPTVILPAGFAFLFAWPPQATYADRLVVNGTEYAGARIVAMQRGRLRFRQADGRLDEAWADEVDRIHVEHGGAFMDFNQAERLVAEGKMAAAIPRYTRSLRLVEDFWPDLISIRLVKACDATGDFDDAVEHFIRVLLGPHAGPTAAARIIPQGVPTKRNAKVTRAMARIAAKLRGGSDVTDAQKALLRLLRYEILRHTGDEETVAAARDVATSAIPAAARSTQAYAIVHHALETLLQSDPDETLLEGLDAAIRDCPKESLAGFLLLKGKTLLRTAATQEDLVRAAWPLMRVAIHLGNDPLAPEALFEAATALERIGRKGQAADLLRECREHRKVSAKTGALAKVAWERLQSSATD